LFLSLAAGRPRRLLYSFLLGAAFGVSFLFRPNNAVVEAAVILALLIVQLLRRDLRSMLIQLLSIAAGALVPLGITLLYFWSQGPLAPLLEASFLYNLTYSSTSIGAAPPLITGFRLFGAAAWIALAGYGLAIYRLSRRDPLHPLYLLLLVGWPLVIFTSDPARRGYAHYFMNWLPFLALLAGLLIDFLVSRLPAAIRESRLWQSASLGILLLACVGAFVFGGPAADYRKALERFPRRASIGLDVRTRTAAYVENHTEPGQLVLFWAATPGENFMSRRESPSAYLFYPLYVPSPISARMNRQFLQDVITKRPVLIVDIGDHEALSLDPVERTQQIEAGYAWEYPPNSLEEFFQYVEQHYYLEARVGDRAVYRLRPR
jgi:hypothetical protein